MTAHAAGSSLFRQILGLVWSEADTFAKRRIAIAMLVLVASSALATLAPVALKLVVDGFAHPNGAGNYLAPGVLVVMYVVAQWLYRCSGELRGAIYGPARQRIERRVSRRLFAHVMALPLRFHVDRRTGALAQTLDLGISGCQIILDHVLFSIVPVAAELLMVAVILMRLDLPVVLCVLSVASVLYATAFARGIRQIITPARSVSSAQIESNAVLTDCILNYETVKYFNAEALVQDRYDRALTTTESHWRSFCYVKASNGLVVVTVFAVSLGVAVTYSAYQVLQGAMTVGDFVLVNAYMLHVVRPLEILGFALRDITEGLGYAAKMLDLLRQEPESRTAARLQPPLGRGELQFDHVTFSYRPDCGVLKDVSFAIAPGKFLAIVGASGAGKSSLLRLLMRLYEPERGRILLGGVPIAEMSLQELRSAIAVVPQDTILFNETIAYNIAFGRRGCSYEEIEGAARIAHLHDFIRTLPDGYDTVVGERGAKLSGGEKQRVAIARAALKRPQIYVFDEATSSLDTRTEREILLNLIEVARSCTTLAIAHRLSTVLHADEIVVLESGAIVERGTHDALLRANGTYAAMWRAQQRAAPALHARAAFMS